MALIRILFIIFLVYYLIRFLDKHVVPYLFGKPKEKTKANRNTASKEFRKKTSQGEVTITDYGGKTKDVKARDDDFVDFEEVE